MSQIRWNSSTVKSFLEMISVSVDILKSYSPGPRTSRGTVLQFSYRSRSLSGHEVEDVARN